ncbi:STAS domain-containing protein [Leptospira kirschneri]|uniref:STAS domain protein n=1 Tax=Leptospira kirschneri str. 200802841 TaxID=1193047 RepID=A0A828Y9S4_9LEPT|nr:STAS domain-containing protein [Leptospira kirschneri]EMO75516.1 STAS domain protein [Leptospira kirschneri str. 200801925]EJO68892.1 STAS domain protein [Leptospira kirschneri serovar Grippotyphosa str. RM52]EKO52218.1 STAS domain protein [Leptospira kirschneri str. 200802841]EKP06334.1 STAS domain protein [Leptospira kirschneri str. 2008720114]EKQ85172.1 STAS domain protein [Leptospira kirschneri serovar Grippotyphosa str. Moskva]
MSEIPETIEITPDLSILFHDYYTFRTMLMEAIAKKPKNIVLNLGNIPIMNSISISSLIWFLKNARSEGIGCTISSIHPDLLNTFEILNLKDYLEVQ